MSQEFVDGPVTHGPWTILDRRVVYADPWLKVTRDEVLRPDGSPGTYSLSHMKPGVCVLAIDHDRVCRLTEEFHYGVGRVTLEGVSGGIDPGEDPLETAKRELAEELGLRAGRWTSLGMVDPFTAIAVSPTMLYLAEDLEESAASPEPTELIRQVRVPIDEVLRMVWTSEISHAPSVAAIFKAAMLMATRERG